MIPLRTYRRPERFSGSAIYGCDFGTEAEGHETEHTSWAFAVASDRFTWKKPMIRPATRTNNRLRFRMTLAAIPLVS